MTTSTQPSTPARPRRGRLRWDWLVIPTINSVNGPIAPVAGRGCWMPVTSLANHRRSTR